MGQSKSKKVMPDGCIMELTKYHKKDMPDDCIMQLTKYHNMLDNFPQTMEIMYIKYWFQKTIIMCKIHLNGKIDLKTDIENDVKYINYLLAKYQK